MSAPQTPGRLITVLPATAPDARALQDHAPVVARCLSPLGRRVSAPAGIPAQAREAASCATNAVLGQVTDGRGGADPLPSMGRAAQDPSGRSLLYQPPAGSAALVDAWQARQAAEAPAGLASGRPIVVHGITQGLSIAADLFCDEDTDVILPDLAWDNYPALFSLRSGARIVRYPFYSNDRFNIEGLAAALAGARRKAVVVLNFPHNPTGYVPTAEEARRIVETLNAAPVPVVAVVDDAYLGLVYDAARPARSIYWDLLEGADPERVFALRVDGATKTYGFFGGRVGFVSFSLPAPAAAALSGKICGLICATTLAAATPSQDILRMALLDPAIEQDRQRMVRKLGRRHAALRQALLRHRSDLLRPLPGHGGAFVTVEVDLRIDADHLRRHLIEAHGVGVVSLPGVNALRVAFCSVTAEDLDRVAAALATAADELAPALAVAC